MDKENYRDKKYRDDTVFQKINKKFLTLSDEEIRNNNEHLKMVEKVFIPLLKKDELFNLLFKRIMYGGSFYKGTRFGKPVEFDLDCVIKLPINYMNNIKIDTNHKNYGFVRIKINTDGPFHPSWMKHAKLLSKWLTADGFLDQNKFHSWMERIVTSAFSMHSKTTNGSYEILYCDRKYMIMHKKTGPAFTIILQTPDGARIDVDLVPCLEFDNLPLGNGYKNFIGNKKTWMAVAKPLSLVTNSNLLWRLCFYEQEKEFLQGDIKPVIRMVKKFRDTMKWKSVASYYIETVFYHELEKHKPDLFDFLRAPKTYLFMLGLKKLQYHLEKKELPYFWHGKHNLFSKMNSSQLESYANHLKKLIVKFDENILMDRYVLADLKLEHNPTLKLMNLQLNQKIRKNRRLQGAIDYALD
ncbi:uncharacterized protein LOC106638568 [Copidosoma floridanum]|uniref:uncharacterized protein LOC106638568 n=1 Tax=Copidosoma floridanum TaxID=29053 RepID=UPI0006C9C894|nr:uncharacterized protein LOC106638568 [Copidosoma floridanum]